MGNSSSTVSSSKYYITFYTKYLYHCDKESSLYKHMVTKHKQLFKKNNDDDDYKIFTAISFMYVLYDLCRCGITSLFIRKC